jgi:hypothetical protein
MRDSALSMVLLLGTIGPHAAPAQSAPATEPGVHYHYGDNPAWSVPSFDDRAWPQAQNGGFLAPSSESDGFFWVRARISVPTGDTGLLAIETQLADAFPNVQELWINGWLVGRYGDFPPHARPLVAPQMLIFDVPAGVVQSGSVAIVALHIWDGPYDGSERLVMPGRPDPVSVTFSIGSAALLHAVADRAQDRAWLRFWPHVMQELVFIMLGVAVLVFGTWTRDRTLLLCALWLVTMPAQGVFSLLFPLSVGFSSPIIDTAFFFATGAALCVGVEFLWTVQGFRDRTFRAVAHFCWIGLIISQIFSANRMDPGLLASEVALAASWLLFSYNVISGGANLAAIAGWGRNRWVAAAMILINIGYFLRVSGHPLNFGWPGLDFFMAAFYVADVFIAVLLMWQTWTAWRKAEDLRIEFAAAREVQRRLVPVALPQIDRFRFRAAFIPAAEVGGDFYQVFSQADRSALVVIGDVSGKGLKAAMTGTLVLGALRTLAQQNLSPSQILLSLNAQFAASSDGGFVTCLCTRITTDGTLTLANAGHLAPYCNGEEVPLDSALPLGVAPGAEYAESTIHLNLGDTLTFLSDGVVEAQSSRGELFGFDRARRISTQPAEEIARAAQAFGQEDDITVLTLTVAPAAVAHA